jgi:hypothetical protein
MLRKTLIALWAAAAVAMFAPDAASARGGGMGGGMHGGGGFHGGGFGGGMHVGGGPHVGGFHGGGFHGGFHGFHRRFAGIGLGFYAPYDYGDYYPYDGYYADEGDGGCYLVRRRVHTRNGVRLRTVQICQ